MAAAILVSVPLCVFAEEEKGHICFKTIDANKDDRVTFEEFVEYLGEDREKFTRVDQNGDGELTHEEYHVSLGHGASEQETD
jgi:Ca2+-binding EF-hand superfamily protein